MKCKNGLVAAVLLSAAVGSAEAQTRTIIGRVTDFYSGEPIPEGHVSVKGMSIGDNLRPDGVFVLHVPVREVTIVVSSDGYRTREVAIPIDQEAVIIALDVAGIELKQVVVSGRATGVHRRHLSTSNATVSGEDINRVPAASIEQALQGKVAGSDIQRNSGVPGGDFQVRLRGLTTILGSVSPLYILDGTILGDPSILGGTSAITGVPARVPSRIADLNPNDIASIEILKGAAASTMYGSKGANGVVIIRTRRGRGRPRE